MALEIDYNVSGCFREPKADIELASAAVEAGFDGIWIADHFLPWLDSRPYTHHVLPWLGSLMSEVPDVRVGTSVTCPMLRYHPPLLAQAIATLDNMYPGRFNFGIGVGEALNEAHFGEWPDWDTRAEMMIEAIELMERLWKSDTYLSHDGDHFSYDRIKLYTRPKERIPIHWAGWGPRSCRYAGKYAGNITTTASVDVLESRVIPEFEEGLDSSERTIEEADVTAEVHANIGEPSALVSEIRQRGEYIPADTELDNPDPRSIQRVADKRLQGMSDDEIADDLNITDECDEVIELLQRYEDAGVDRVVIGSVCGDPYSTIEAFEEEILDSFNH